MYPKDAARIFKLGRSSVGNRMKRINKDRHIALYYILGLEGYHLIKERRRK